MFIVLIIAIAAPFGGLIYHQFVDTTPAYTDPTQNQEQQDEP